MKTVSRLLTLLASLQGRRRMQINKPEFYTRFLESFHPSLKQSQVDGYEAMIDYFECID